MFFAAKETVERWAAAKDAKAEARGREEGREAGRKEGREEGWKEGREEGRKQGREEGRKQGREEARKQVIALLEEHNVQLPPELLRRLNGDEDPS